MWTNEIDLLGKFLQNHPLADYNSWRVGGPADFFYLPANIADLCSFLKQSPENMPIVWLGLGSNVLIRDSGVEGIVIITQGALTGLTLVEKNIVRAEAGVANGQMARFTARRGLRGLEFMAGIPGTVGGALAMNAGCYGGETWQYVQKVETVDRLGNIHIRNPDAFEIGYRHVKGMPNEWFVAGYFELKPGEKSHSLSDIRVLLEKRNASQPTNMPNCGSVFRNPPGQFAAKLIEQAGLKGHAIGGAKVSEKHANFIINEGKASASDIENLICDVREKVFIKHGVRLIPEVCIIGRIAFRSN